jgi:hypothetical protein
MQASSCKNPVSVTKSTANLGYVKVASGNEADLMDAVSTKGPVAVAIDATTNFQQYQRGNAG